MSFEIFTPTPPVSNINAEYVVSPLYKNDPNVPVITFPLTEITLFPDPTGTNVIKQNTLLNQDSSPWYYYNGILSINISYPDMYFELGPFYISSGGTYQLCINFLIDANSGPNVLDVFIDGIFKTQINIPSQMNQINYLCRESIGTLTPGFHTIKVINTIDNTYFYIYDSIRLVKID